LPPGLISSPLRSICHSCDSTHCSLATKNASLATPRRRGIPADSFISLAFCKLHLLMCRAMPRKRKSKRRSGCPVSVSLDLLGDRWSLLIIRDLMVRGYRTFKEFEESGESIATNILTDRLRKLKSTGIITTQVDETDGRKVNYRLTQKGIDLAPVLLELLIWGARHENTEASCAVIENMASNRDSLVSEVRRRWEENDATPLQVNGRWIWP
jgi:DNA-binding HxlR family transcriptional regulator